MAHLKINKSEAKPVYRVAGIIVDPAAISYDLILTPEEFGFVIQALRIAADARYANEAYLLILGSIKQYTNDI